MNSLLIAFTVASQALGLPPGLMAAVCYRESRHQPYAMNVDDGGSKSIGVCQIKLATAKLMGFKGTETQLMDPGVNIYFAAKYLKKQLVRYNGDVKKAVSAYNAGRYKPKNKPYVDFVLVAWEGYKH